MHIKNIFIDRFGKLRKRSFDFHEGINIIYGQNEAGKSTLQSFILSSFYGARTSRKNNIDARKQYIPYGKDYAFGNMNIELDGMEVTIERKISGKKKDDFFRAYDRNTFDQVSLSENLGKALFDVELEEFIKTLYINQNATKFLSEHDEGLSTKLTNLMETGDEAISFTKAMDRIDKEMKLIRGARKNGRLDDVYEELSSLYIKLDQARASEKVIREKKIEMDELEKQHQELKLKKQDIHHLKDKIHLYEVKNEFLRIRKNLEELALLKEQQKSRFTVASDEELKIVKEKEAKLADVEENLLYQEEKLDSLKRLKLEHDLIIEPYRGFEEIGRDSVLKLVRMQGEEMLLEEKLKYFDPENRLNQNLLLRREELGKVLRTYEKHLTGLKSKKSVVYILSLSILLAALIYYSLFQNLPRSLFMAVFSVVLYIFGRYVEKKRITRHLRKVDETEETIAVLSRELGMDHEEVIRSKRIIDKLPKDDERLRLSNRYEEVKSYKDSILTLTSSSSVEEVLKGEEEYRILHEKQDDIRKQIRQTEDEIERNLSAKNQIMDSFQALITRLGFDEEKHKASEFLEEYELELMRMKELTMREEALRYAIKGLVGDRSEEEVKAEMDTLDALGFVDGSDLKTLEEKERMLGEEEIGLLEKISAVKLTLSETDFTDPLFIEDSILILKDEETRLKRRYEVLELTRSIMKDSYEKLRTTFSGNLNESVTEIYTAITGTDRNIKVSDLFSMSFQESGMLWNDSLLSHGSLEQLYLSLRLAMADLIYEGRKVPLILDEAFASYDEKRLEAALDYLQKHTDRYQILIFTCHRREIEILGEAANIINI